MGGAYSARGWALSLLSVVEKSCSRWEGVALDGIVEYCCGGQPM